jgi:hypothetical protein
VFVWQVDSITNTQRVFEFATKREHGVIVRGKNLSIFSSNFKMDCKGFERSGVLEDEMYMTSLVMMSRDIQCEVRDCPIDKWPLTLSMSWGVCYPLHRFRNCVFWKNGEGVVAALGQKLSHVQVKLAIMYLFSTTRH